MSRDINKDWRDAAEYHGKWVAADMDTDQPVIVADDVDELHEKIEESDDVDFSDVKIEKIRPPAPPIVRQT